ncbi:hypothetical protein ACLOJK_036736 [Asimina triloba]
MGTLPEHRSRCFIFPKSANPAAIEDPSPAALQSDPFGSAPTPNRERPSQQWPTQAASIELPSSMTPKSAPTCRDGHSGSDRAHSDTASMAEIGQRPPLADPRTHLIRDQHSPDAMHQSNPNPILVRFFHLVSNHSSICPWRLRSRRQQRSRFGRWHPPFITMASDFISIRPQPMAVF